MGQEEGFGVAVIIGAVVVGMGFGGCVAAHTFDSKTRISNETEVQSGYVAPAKVKIYCEDLDKNSQLETIISIEGKPYALMIKDGKPVILSYAVKPAEVIYTE